MSARGERAALALYRLGWTAVRRLPEPVADPTIRSHAAAEVLLERYGVVTRGSVAAEQVPGGFGTLDGLFEALTLIQTGRMARIPVLLFGAEFWDGIINWQALARAGTISASDLDLIRYVETADEAWDKLATVYGFDVPDLALAG